MAEIIEKQYAEVLWEVANEMDAVDQLNDNFAYITAFLSENQKISALLEHPELTKDEKKEILSSFVLMKMLNIFVEKGSLEALASVQEKFAAISNERSGIAVGVVNTAIPIGEEEIQKLEQSFSSKLNKIVKLTNEVDETILGGVVVKIGDKIYDSSVKSQLDRISSNLLTSATKKEEVDNS